MNSTDILNIILGAFKNNKPIQSLLFIGPQYASKFLIAKELAKALNCQKENFCVCNDCESCKKINLSQHPDFHVYGLNSDSIKIADIHDLQKFINLRPYQASKKIFVIKDAHNLTNDTANCLLKTLEEPPKDSLIILTTSKLSKIFSTITSRCQKFYFPMTDKNNSEKFSSEFKNKVIDAVFIKKDLTKNLTGLDQRREFKIALEIVLSILRDVLFLKLSMPVDDLINVDRVELLNVLEENIDLKGLFNIFDDLQDLLLMTEQNINLKLIFDVLLLKIETSLLTRGALK